MKEPASPIPRYCQGPRARRHRSADHSEEAAPALFAVARPVRFGSLDQPRRTPSMPASRPLQGNPDRHDHQLKNATYPVLKLVDGVIKRVDEPALTALNMRLRDDYTQDCVKACCAGTRSFRSPAISTADAAGRRFPSQHRVSSRTSTPRRKASLIDDATGTNAGRWVPSTQDGDFIASLMKPVTEVVPTPTGSRREGRHRQQARRFRVVKIETEGSANRALHSWDHSRAVISGASRVALLVATSRTEIAGLLSMHLRRRRSIGVHDFDTP